MEDLPEMSWKVREQVGLDFLDDGSRLKVETIQQKNAQIFDWLKLQDMNVIVIIVLMVVVAGFSMISALLILILEKTNMIGILKSMGAKTWTLRRVFLYIAVMSY